MTYGIVQLGVPIHSWVNIFFLIGGITTAFGFVVYIILPDSPFSARFLNERERYVVSTLPFFILDRLLTCAIDRHANDFESTKLE